MLYSHHTELEEGREKAMSDKNRKPVIPQVITVAFMVVLPLTVDKINHNGVLLGYHPDTGGGECTCQTQMQGMVTGCCEVDDDD